MEAYPSAETLAKVVKKLKVEKYDKIFAKITNQGWWSRINLVNREMTNALINFFEVEMKFPSQEVESEESAVEEVEEERLEKTNFMAYRFANAMAKSIMNKMKAKKPEDREKE